MKKLLLLLIIIFGISALHADDFTGWRETTYGHFTFIYEERDAYAVNQLLTFCEEVYNNVTSFLEYAPENINCVIHGRIDYANGSFAPLPAHINLYLTPPIGPQLGSKTENPLKLLLTHELTHFVHLTYDRGFLHWLSRIFGPMLKASTQSYLPYWMIEGITTNTETLFTDGGRGTEPFFEMLYKAPIIEEAMFSYRQAAYESVFPPSGRVYVAGYILVDFILENYGENAFTEIHRQYLKFPFFGAAASIKKITGKNGESIFQDMKLYLEDKYKSDALIPDGELLSPEITANYYFPEITDIGWILYKTSMEQFPSIILFNPETKEEKVLLKASINDYSSLSASKSGESVIFASAVREGINRSGDVITSDLYLLNTGDESLRPLTRNAHLWQPCISADGTELIAVQRNGTGSRLVSVDMGTGRLSLLFSENGARVFNPSISPDGKKIAFVLNSGGMQDICVMDFPEEPLPGEADMWPASWNTAKQHIIIGSPSASEYYPEFAGNNAIIFSSDINGRLELFSAEPGKKDSILLCSDPVAAWRGEILGDKIIYSSYSSGGFNLKAKTAGEKPAEIAASLYTFSPKEENTKPFPPSVKYCDPAYPVIWYPLPIHSNPFQAEIIAPGAGISIMGLSILGSKSWDLTVSFPFTDLQPRINLNLSTDIGLFNLAYTLYQGYGAYPGGRYIQDTQQNIKISRPLISGFKLDRGTKLSVYTGIRHNLRIGKEEPFPFFNKFDFETVASANYLSSISGIDFSFYKPGGTMDLHTPFMISESFSAELLVPVFEGNTEGIILENRAFLSIPSFFPHHVFKAGIRGRYISTALLFDSNGNPRYTRKYTPRGLFDPEEMTSEINMVTSFDYLFTIAALDIPLLFGTNLQGIGGGLHIELQNGINTGSARIVLGNYIYTGIEINMITGFLSSTIPYTFGLSVRFDPEFRDQFDPLKDIRPYFTLGLDSL